jgi:hypothetical protein
VIICIAGKTKYVTVYSKNIYVFRSNELGQFEIHNSFRIKNIHRILGEFKDEIVVSTDTGGSVFVLGKTGVMKRPMGMNIHHKTIASDHNSSQHTLFRADKHHLVDKVFLHFCSVRTYIVMFSARQNTLKLFFTMYELKDGFFVVKTNFLRVLDYKGTVRKGLRNDGRMAIDTLWDDSANFYIIEMSTSFKERVAISVYKRELNFGRIEQRVLAGLGLSGLPRSHMLIQDWTLSYRAYVHMLDTNILYLPWKPGKMDYSERLNRIAVMVKPCGILTNVTWPVETIIHCNIFHYFVDNRDRLVAWPKTRQRGLFRAEVFTIK